MIEFNSLAAVTGRSGLYVILKPTRTGVILESLDGLKTRFIIDSNSKVSILKDISIYTVDADRNLILQKVMTLIYNANKEGISVSAKSSDAELRTFLKNAMPQYDEERVYASDIRKLISWYAVIIKNEPSIFEPKEEISENEAKPAIAPPIQESKEEIKVNESDLEAKKITKAKKSKA